MPRRTWIDAMILKHNGSDTRRKVLRLHVWMCDIVFVAVIVTVEYACVCQFYTAARLHAG